MTKDRVLCVSFDRTVSDMRSDALRKAGFTVTTTTKISEAMELLLSGEKFDLVIIGHRFSREEKRGLARMAREDCSTPVLLAQVSIDSDIPADSRVYALDGTAGLLKEAKLLLAKRKSATL